MFNSGEKEEKEVIKRMFWRNGNLEFEFGKLEIIRRNKEIFIRIKEIRKRGEKIVNWNWFYWN